MGAVYEGRQAKLGRRVAIKPANILLNREERVKSGGGEAEGGALRRDRGCGSAGGGPGVFHLDRLDFQAILFP